jgi:hypothetical protein
LGCDKKNYPTYHHVKAQVILTGLRCRYVRTSSLG